MISQKKGLSSIVTTLIIVLFSIIAVTIVWYIISGLIEDTAEQIEGTSDCVFVELEIQNVECQGNDCTVVVKRNKGPDFSGVRVVLNNETDSVSVDSEEDIGIAEIQAYSLQDLGNPTEASVTAYFLNSEGEQQYCPNVVTYPIN